jgi:predicted RNA polymerase sigma factor
MAVLEIGGLYWPQILALYDLLNRISDNPMVALNRAIAAAMVHGTTKGLELLDALLVLSTMASLRSHKG